MNEYDSPNFAEYVYDRKNEGKVKKIRTAAICGYVLFGAGAAAILASFFPWGIAILPIFIWMLVYFTWGFVSHDLYYEFNHGQMEFGAVRVTKNGRRRRPRLKLVVKEASLAKVYKPGEDSLDGIEKVYDFSESQTSDKRIILFFNDGGKSAAVIFEGTARVAKLIASFCQNGTALKGEILHG